MNGEYEFSELSPLEALASWGLPGEIFQKHENGVVCIHCPKLPTVAIYASEVIDTPMYSNVMEDISAWVPDEHDTGRIPVILWRRIGQGFCTRNRRVILWTLRYPNPIVVNDVIDGCELPIWADTIRGNDIRDILMGLYAQPVKAVRVFPDGQEVG